MQFTCHKFLAARAGIAALALLAIGGARAAEVPTIVNGSFEQDVITADSTSSRAITGWVKTFHGPIALVNGDLYDNYGNSYGVTPFGSQYVGLDPQGPASGGFRAGISQDVDNFVAGQTYQLTLYVADSDGGKAPELEVMFSDGGDTIYQDATYAVPVGGPYGDTIGFTAEVIDFTATVSGDIWLSLFNAGSAYTTTDPGSISIDNVSISLISAVPEAGTSVTMLLGLGVLGASLARPRKSGAKAA